MRRPWHELGAGAALALAGAALAAVAAGAKATQLLRAAR
jgi:hypothetical protein